jgi:plasmid stability protein
MPAVVIRNLTEETHLALKRRAALKGSSTEAEIRAILEEAVKPRLVKPRLVKPRLEIGTELASFARHLDGLDFSVVRDPAPTDPAIFE